ncbi:MAG: ZIP family metal transporter [Clostridia bacterium]|nr:ZIP family metal transporter [Clostridia bacterium]
MLSAILWSVIGGVVGTFCGALLAVLTGDKDKYGDFMPSVMGLASGFIIVVLFGDMIPEAIEDSGVAVVVGVATIGCAAVWGASALLSRSRKHKHESTHSDACAECRRAGLIFAIALTLHNLPEGMAMGSIAGSDNAAMLALSVAWHNIPEGMALTVLLCKGGLGRVKSVLITVGVGAVTVVGAVIGYYISGISAMFSGICTALSAGALLYIIFGDMLADAYKEAKSKSVSLFIAIGVLLGLLIAGVH